MNQGVSDYDYGVIFIAFVKKIILCPIIYITEHFFLQMCHMFSNYVFDGRKSEAGMIKGFTGFKAIGAFLNHKSITIIHFLVFKIMID